jgi:hypothetical protein
MELTIKNVELIFDESFFNELKLSLEPNIKIPSLKFIWDGSDIGPIDDHIYSCQKSEDDHILALWTKNQKGESKLVLTKILKYKNEIPIIIDEMKPLFGIKKVGKHKASIRGFPIILIRYQGDVSLKRYMNDSTFTPEKMGKSFIQEIRRLFAFRSLVCLNNNYENTLEVRTGSGINHPISCRENNFNYDSCSKATRIPRTIVRTWFEDDIGLAEESILNLIKDKDLSILRFDIQKIIMKFDKQLISWNNAIFEKMLTFQK